MCCPSFTLAVILEKHHLSVAVEGENVRVNGEPSQSLSRTELLQI